MMKRCPKCNSSFSDETLQYCLSDGERLVSAASSSFDPQAKTLIDPAAQGFQQAPARNVNQAAPQSPYPSTLPSSTRKGNPLLWIIGGVLALGLLGSGLIVLILALSATGANTSTSNTNYAKPRDEATKSNSNVNLDSPPVFTAQTDKTQHQQSPSSSSASDPMPVDYSAPKIPMSSNSWLSIGAGDLLLRYDRDPNAADDQFKGKAVLLSGMVIRTGKDKDGVSYVVLKDAGSAAEYLMKDKTPKVYAYFAGPQEFPVADLQPGWQIVLKGRCDGRSGKAIVVGGCFMTSWPGHGTGYPPY